MENTNIEGLQKQLEQYKLQLAEARQEAETAKAKEAAVVAAAEKAGLAKPITGAYKGFSFVPGHNKIRDAKGRICDTQKTLDAANTGDGEACAILDRLIDIQYGYLVPAEAEGKTQKAKK
jgi:hypothetical protein